MTVVLHICVWTIKHYQKNKQRSTWAAKYSCHAPVISLTLFSFSVPSCSLALSLYNFKHTQSHEHQLRKTLVKKCYFKALCVHGCRKKNAECYPVSVIIITAQLQVISKHSVNKQTHCQKITHSLYISSLGFSIEMHWSNFSLSLLILILIWSQLSLKRWYQKELFITCKPAYIHVWNSIEYCFVM